MVTWTKQKNGHVLTIKMDDEEILKELEQRKENFRIAVEEEEGEGSDEYETSGFYRAEVGHYDSCLPPDECMTDLDDMVDCVNKLCCEGDADVIFDMAAYKKNGTFKRNTKPVIRQQRFGTYDDDSYGWRTSCLRLEPFDDFNAEIQYTCVTEHY